MRKGLIMCAAVFAVAGCGKPESPPPAPKSPPATAAAGPQILSPQTVDQAGFSPEAALSADRSATVLRAQVLLDRARFSPGEIDGKPGENLRQAIAAFEEARGLPIDGQLDAAVFTQLTAADARPVLTSYTITEEDVAGPFSPLPDDFKAQSELDRLGFESVQEALAEKFHVSPELLAELNPGVDFGQAGTSITVPQLSEGSLAGAVALIEVDKADRAVKAYDAKGTLLAFYPATIGSEERPAPEGVLKVTGVAQDPTYTFDPTRLTYSQPGVKTKTTLPAGPNNPVGTVWIGLSKETFGIHGSDEPKEIGKKFSHGCIRLSNWDAEELAAAVKAGVKVSFIEESAAGLRQAAAKAAQPTKPKAG